MKMKSNKQNQVFENLNKKSPELKQQWSQQIVQKILQLSNEKGQSYLSINSMNSVLAKINKNHIEIIDKFSIYKINGFNLLEFVRFFLNIIDHQPIQNLFLTIGLVDLFKEISTFVKQEKLTFSHITNYVCQKILQKKQSKNQIQAKNITGIRILKPNYQLKEYIRNPPLIYGSSDQNLFKLSLNSISADKIKHARAVCESYFSQTLKIVFTLDNLTQYISCYDIVSNQVSTIYPSFNKIKKDVVILGFCFSQRQYRIGATLKNYSLIFWDHQNKFQYEKSWSTTTFCQQLQTFIRFLQYFNSWITCDKTGTIYIWDLLLEKPQRKLKLKYFCSITSICEIPSLNIIAVSQQSKQINEQLQVFQKKNNCFQSNIVLYNYFNGQVITQISSQERVPHTVKYSQQYQILFSAGLQKRIKLFQINPTYMDANLRGQLIGHQNLITCFTLIKKTSLLISSDDKGKIKLWDFKNLACIQTIDFSDKAMISNLLDMIQVGKIGVFGSRINYIEFQDKAQVIKSIKKKQKISIQAVDLDQNKMEIYIFTQKDLRIINMQTGSIKHIFKNFNFSDGDYTCFKYFSCIGMFALGNDKGQINVFSISTGELMYQLKTQHEGSVLFIQYDQLNKLFITIGIQSTILVHKESTRQLIRQMKGNFNGKEICSFSLSVYHNLIAIGTHQKQQKVYLWNYQYGKIVGCISLKKESYATNLQFINGYNILIISCQSGDILFVQIIPSLNYQIQMRLIQCLQTKSSILKLNLDIVINGRNKFNLQKCLLYVSHENSFIELYNLYNFLKPFKICDHSKQKTNYNPFRQLKQSFSSEIIKNKHYKFNCYNEFNEIESQFSKLPFQASDQKKPHQIQNFQKLKCFNADLFPLNMVKLINFEENYILSVGINRRIKIFDQKGQTLCDMNINYPLPYLWNFKPKKIKKIQDKIYFSIKIINTILCKYQNDISVGQSKNLKLKPLFDCLRKSKESSQFQNKKSELMLTEPPQYHQKQNVADSVPLLQQEYSKKDLNYQLVKEFNFYQIAGPTLKQMDHIKKIQHLQRDWKQKEKNQQNDRSNLLKIIQTKVKKNEQKQQLGTFLSSNYHAKSVPAKQNSFIQSLTKKIQSVSQEQQQKQRHNTLFKFSKGVSQKDKQIAKKQPDEQLFKKCKSYKFLNRRLGTTFENYYFQKKQQEKKGCIKQKNKDLLKLTTVEDDEKCKISKSLRRIKTANNLSQYNNLRQHSNFIQQKMQNDRKLISKDYRFRTILTEMDTRIKKKRVKHQKFQF